MESPKNLDSIYANWPPNTAWINLEVSDRVVYNLSDCLIKMAASIKADKDMIITFNAEGPSIEKLSYRREDNVLRLLESICDQLKYDPKRITLLTNNVIENVKCKFKVLIENTMDGWFYGKHLRKIQVRDKDISYHFGNFVSNSTYPRLLLASHLHKYHANKTLQTYRRNPKNPAHAVNLDLDKLMFECTDPKALINVTEFIQHLPLELEKELKDHPKASLSAGEDGDAVNPTIMSWYSNFFCDVVTETFFSGDTFFPTEKTMRPLLNRNPFIIHGPRKFLYWLKKLGFKTFSGFWSEDYDHLEGYDRCQAIYKILDKISAMDITEIRNMHDKMQPILEHNRQNLLSLDYIKMDKFISDIGSLLARY